MSYQLWFKMVKRTGTTTPELQEMIRELKKQGSENKINLWKRVAEELDKSKRQRRISNLDKINKHTREGEIALVPGKILSEGELTKKITVAGYRFSEQAKEKINSVGKAISIQELLKENPKGSKVRIIG